MTQHATPEPPRPNHEAIPPEQVPAASPLPSPPVRRSERSSAWAWWAFLVALVAIGLLARHFR